MFTFLLSCLLLVPYGFVEALSPISVKGTKLYDDGGNQFFVKGVSYIPLTGDFDPLLDAEQCRTDAEVMSRAGINTIYVYTADSTQSHDACMKAFADKGIYIWLQLGDFPRVTEPTEEAPQWTLALFAAWSEALDAFAGYNNTLALGIGQETITEKSTSTRVAPALKAAARDLRAFRTARGYRAVPLAYSVADAPALRLLTAQYLACDNRATADDDAASIDLIGLNIFNPDSCTPSAWSTLRDNLQNMALPIPVVISETGCMPSAGRNLSDVARVLTAGAFRDVFSGASVFEWTRHEETEFGVVRYADNGKGAPQVLLPAYASLSSVYNAAATVTGTPAAQYTPPARTGEAALACPALDEKAGWLVDGNAPLPVIEGLQIGTITVQTTVTAGAGGSEATGGAGQGGGQGQGQVEGDDGGGGGELSTGAIAGITVGSVIGVLLLVTGIVVCLRRRRRAVAPRPEGDDGAEVVPHFQFRRPRSYWYPPNKVELPAQNMAAVEMDGSLHSAASSAPVWKIPLQDGRDDSPTVTNVPDQKWQQWQQPTTHYELDGNHGAWVGDGTQTGTWRVSPLTPGNNKYV